MAEVGPALEHRLSSAQDFDLFEVNIFLKGEPADAGLLDAAQPEGAAANIERLKAQAANSQQGLLGMLDEEAGRALLLDDGSSVLQVSAVEPLWINNSVKAELSRDALDKVIAREDVAYVELVHRASPEELFDEQDFLPKRAGFAPLGEVQPLDAPRASAPTWSVTRVNAPLLWKKGIDGEGVIVAVIDSGVNYLHPDLVNRMWSNQVYPNHGYDFDNDDNDPLDDQGHGTCCAGIVAGDGTSGKGTGVAPGAQIIAVKVGGSDTRFWKGMQFAIDRGAHVISMSMTFKYPSRPDYPGWRRACETVLAAGLLHANSIGNQGDDLSTYPIPFNIATPGNCPPPRIHPLQTPVGGTSSPISCGATDSNDALAVYSGRGPAEWNKAPYADYPHSVGQAGLIKPDICAPGPGTESCDYQYRAGSTSSPYTSFGGTSSATPHVAGCLALLACASRKAGRAINPVLIQEAIENGAKRVVGQTTAKENHYGAGRIDVFAAFNYGLSKGWW